MHDYLKCEVIHLSDPNNNLQCLSKFQFDEILFKKFELQGLKLLTRKKDGNDIFDKPFDKNHPLIGGQPQNVYFISEREIIDGDLCYNSFDNRIWQYKPTPCPMPYWGNKKTLKKIEATSNLTMKLPIVRMDFMEKYAEQQGDINYVLLKLNKTLDKVDITGEYRITNWKLQ